MNPQRHRNKLPTSHRPRLQFRRSRGIVFVACLILFQFRSVQLSEHLLLELTLLIVVWLAAERCRNFWLVLTGATAVFGLIVYSVQETGLPRRSGVQLSVAVVAIFVIAAWSAHVERRLYWFAEHDPLTGLLNQQGFLNALQHRLRFHDVQSGPLVVAFMDCDAFKVINDTLGHLAGDQYLVEVGQRIREVLQAHEHAARWGGDEFVILLHAENEEFNLQRIRSLEQALNQQDALRHVASTWSIGVVLCSASAQAEQVIATADRAMYLVKKEGGGKLHVLRC